MGVRVHLGGRDIFEGPQEVGYGAHVPSREVLKFPLGHLFGVAADPALCAAERKSHDRRLEGHPHCQSFDLVGACGRMESEAPLGGPQSRRMLGAPTGENLHRPIVHSHRNGDFQRFLGLFQPLVGGALQTKHVAGFLNLTPRDLQPLSPINRHPRILLGRCAQWTL